MKRIFSLIIVVILFVSILPMNVIAAIQEELVLSSTVCDEISKALSAYESDKEFVGMEEVNFYNLDISEKISVYEYSSDGFVEIAEAYLLYDGEEIASLAYRSQENPFEFMTRLAKLINATDQKNISIVYDFDGCYLYNGEDFINLCFSQENITSRKKVGQAVQEELTEIVLGDLDVRRSLKYDISVVRSSSVNFFCDVKFVSQRPFTKLCWAACVAMVVEAVNGSSNTAQAIAMIKFGPTNYNQPLDFADTATFMRENFGLQYTNITNAPSDNTLIANISNGYPVIGGFDCLEPNKIGHAVVIYGVNGIAGRIVFMDPNLGSKTCYYTTAYHTYAYFYDTENKEYRYAYTNETNAIIYVLSEGIVMYT